MVDGLPRRLSRCLTTAKKGQSTKLRPKIGLCEYLMLPAFTASLGGSLRIVPEVSAALVTTFLPSLGCKLVVP